MPTQGLHRRFRELQRAQRRREVRHIAGEDAAIGDRVDDVLEEHAAAYRAVEVATAIAVVAVRHRAEQ